MSRVSSAADAGRPQVGSLAGAVHAVVTSTAQARAAVRAGATVLRLTAVSGGRPLEDAGRDLRSLGTPFYVVDDLEAARELGADGVHLDRCLDRWEDARRFGLRIGVAARATPPVAVEYIEVVWGSLCATPASDEERLSELARLCASAPATVIVAGVAHRLVDACAAAGAGGVLTDRQGIPRRRRAVQGAKRSVMDTALPARP